MGWNGRVSRRKEGSLVPRPFPPPPERPGNGECGNEAVEERWKEEREREEACCGGRGRGEWKKGRVDEYGGELSNGRDVIIVSLCSSDNPPESGVGGGGGGGGRRPSLEADFLTDMFGSDFYNAEEVVQLRQEWLEVCALTVLHAVCVWSIASIPTE